MIALRFTLLIGIIGNIPAIIENIINIAMYGHEYLDELSHTFILRGNYTFRTMLNLMLNFPFIIFMYYAMVSGGKHIAGTTTWRMVLSFILLPIIVIVAIAIGVMAFCARYMPMIH